jgi:hypothetical protein
VADTGFCMRLATLSMLIALAGPAAAERSGQVRLAVVSALLFDRGMAADDALQVLAAARLRRAAGLADWADMAEAGRALASAGAVAALLDDLISEGARGVTAGAVQLFSSVGAAASVTLPSYRFSAGAYAEVYVEAEAGTTITVTVRDGAANVVCRRGGSPYAYCGWTPATAGDFSVEIANPTPDPVNFLLMTN